MREAGTALGGGPRLWNTLAVGLCLLGWGPANSWSMEPLADELNTQREAADSIPFDRLTEEAQAKLRPIVANPSLYRRLPVTVIESDPDMYRFLVRYPEVIVNMWQLMDVTKVQVRRTGDYTFDASDGAGTVSTVELIYGDAQTHVLYSEGTYEGPLLRKLIRGRCVMVLKSEYSQTQDESTYVTSRLDMFVQLDNLGAEILAKTLHPLVGRSADHNFVESTRFLGQVSQAAEKRTDRVQQLAARLSNVDPSIRERFVQLATLANQRASQRHTTMVPVVRGNSVATSSP